MSVPVALAMVGTVMGAKTAIEGLKEGNLLKAAVGGFAAYSGVQGLQGLNAATATTAGGSASVADTAAGATNMATVNGAAGSEALEAATQKGLLEGVADGAAQTTTTSGAGGESWLSKAGSWMEKNPTQTGMIAQTAGGLLSGMSQDEQYEALLAEKEAERKRRGAVASSGRVQFNPTTRRMEVVA